ncbi:hypothetical protein LT85_2330 [Collimonas arenae]|uniref:Zn-binding protein involved in type VI secretion n=1 Tax=Collimonas arenae TaxID=279058 RepID=A0A0A1F9R5_9BURK|nr:PAAR domain-containing protein [Collimonas arenae]AIY41488.1 hypothetical protein LT85_2330 [Collimonas arenae]
MINFILLGDKGDHPGSVVITASGCMFFDGRAVARKGDLITCPKCSLHPNPIIEGDETMMDGGVPIARHGHRAACGCRLISSLV